MASENEPAKLLLPYLQRADELQKHEPLVAYYCRLYAMEKGLKIPQGERTKTTNALLISLMKQLEKDKKSLKLGPDDNLHVEGFALNVFVKADKHDRAGRADLNTAKTFYAASIFFETLNQFGPLQPDLEQKQKYAVWKAADIRKALKEGRKPVAGPPSGDGDDQFLPNSTHDLILGENLDSHPRLEPDPSPQFPEKADLSLPTNISPSPSFHDQNSTNIPPPTKFFDLDSHARLEPDPSPQFPEKADHPRPTNISPSPSFHDQNSTNIPMPTKFFDEFNSNMPLSPSTYQRTNYDPHEFHPPPSNDLDNNSTYSQPYPQELQHLAHNYYPNFQSYPSFTDSSLSFVPPQSLPPAPSHPPYYQQIPPPTNYPPVPIGSEPGPSARKSYQYDSDYMPPPEKITEAHKAARFAVGALAFDDVSVAVDYLIKSLELLTNPSASP